jgi:uncharacterized MAPEG superfamily protein
MHIAYWAVFAAGLMPLATIFVAKAQRNYNNADPRTWLEKQEGFRRRADFAHRNHFEAFPFFAAAVLIAQQVQVAQGSIDNLALLFIAARVAYTACYLADLSWLRSIAWFAGHGCIAALFIMAGRL